jgi:hypothetical protein
MSNWDRGLYEDDEMPDQTVRTAIVPEPPSMPPSIDEINAARMERTHPYVPPKAKRAKSNAAALEPARRLNRGRGCNGLTPQDGIANRVRSGNGLFSIGYHYAR